MDHPFRILTDGQVNPSELEALAIAAGVRPDSFRDHWAVRRAAAAYPFIAYARDPEGRLAGYITAFSDGAFSTFVGDLIVRPDARLKDLGLDLLHLVEETYPASPSSSAPSITPMRSSSSTPALSSALPRWRWTSAPAPSSSYPRTPSRTRNET